MSYSYSLANDYLFPVYTSGKQYIPYPCSGSFQSTSLTANGWALLPCYFNKTISISSFTLQVVTAGGAGGKARMAIYRAFPDLFSADLVLDIGEVSVDTTGGKEVLVDATLQPGRYLLGCNTNSTASYLSNATGLGMQTHIGAVSSISQFNIGLRSSGTYGAAPASLSSISNNAQCPIIWFKVA